MNIPNKQGKILLSPKDLEALAPDHNIVGVFNPAATRFNGDIILLVRVTEEPIQDDQGRLFSPRAYEQDGHTCWAIDDFDPASVTSQDPRTLYFQDGRIRLRHISHFRLVRLSADGAHVEEVRILDSLLPHEPWEEFGIEDPRISRIGDTYYITYVAISRQMGIATALMTTRDFQTFERRGIIFPTENKDVVLLPEKWDGHYVAYHRPVSRSQIDAPSIWTSLSPDGIFWGRHQHLISPRPGAWDSLRVGAGPPPVRISQGWLLIYHGVAPATPQSPVGHYCAGAILLDPENPTRLLARSRDVLLYPERPYETHGYTPGVVFPTGIIFDDDRETITLFTGGADEIVASLSVQLQAVLDCLGIS